MHVIHEERPWWLILVMHIGIRLRFLFESWFFLKPFIISQYDCGITNNYRPKDCPRVPYWCELGFKLLWFISSTLRQSRILVYIALKTGFFPLLNRIHLQLTNYVIKSFESSGYDWKKNREIPIPVFDWKNNDPKKFYELFVKNPHPVILKGFMKDSQLLKELTFDNILAKYGEETVMLTKKEEDGYPGLLKEVNNNSVYLHNSEAIFNKYPELLKLLQTHKLEPFVGKMKASFSQLFVGKYGTGSPFHNAAAWNWFYMIDGVKKWYFVDPRDQCLVYPFYQAGIPVSVAFCLYPDDYEQKTFPLHAYCPYYTATVESGDVLFNPAWWWHSIRNVSDQTVAIATRWMSNGICGHDLKMVENNYNINPIGSLSFFSGLYSFSYLQKILKTPSPRFDEHFTLREKHSRYYHHQAKFAKEPGITVLGHRFLF